MLFEYLKRNRKAVAIKFGISLGLDCLVCLIIIGSILSNPLLQMGLIAFITLLSPTGFGFFLFGLVLITGLLCTALWLGIEYLSKHKVGKHELCEEQSNLPEEDVDRQVKDKIILLGLSENLEQREIGEQNEIEEGDLIEAFAQKAEEILKTISTELRRPQTCKQAELEVQLNTIRKYYYRLARIYHPDLEPDESQKALKKREFQRLSGTYEKVQKACNQLKNRIEQQLKPTRLDSLKEQTERIEKLLEMLRQVEKQIIDDSKELNKEIGELKIQIEKNQQRIKANDQKLDEHEQKLKENKKEFHNLLSDLREELNTEENKKEVDETEKLVITNSSETTTCPCAL
jgi:hypothetical protein